MTDKAGKKTKVAKVPKVPMTKEERAKRKAEREAKKAAGDVVLAAGQPPVRTKEEHQLALKKKVRLFYDLQRLRLQHEGRIHKRPKGVEIILTVYDQLILEKRRNELHKAEKSALLDVAEHLRTIPFYKDVLSDKVKYRGIGPTMAGVILSEFDMEKEEYASQMWSFAGLAPVPAQRCKTCWYLVETDKKTGGFKHIVGSNEEKWWKCSVGDAGLTADKLDNGGGKAAHPVKGEKLKYNKWLKTKLVGVLGTVLLRCESPWRKFYDDYKQRKATAGWGKNDAHRHQAAIRYMVKMLLLQIHIDFREYHSLPLKPSYHEQKQLGHNYSGTGPGRHPYEVLTKTEAVAEPEDRIDMTELEADAALDEVDFDIEALRKAM